jgi:hypothetical protein
VADEFQIEQWIADNDCIALAVPALAIFGFLTRDIVLPTGTVALCKRTEGDFVLYHAGERISAQGALEVLWIKTAPIRISLEVDDLRSSEGFPVRARGELSVYPELKLSELRAFQDRLLGSGGKFSVQDLERRIEGPVADAIRKFTASRTADSVVDGDVAGILAEMASERLAKFLFESGLSVEEQLRVTFECETLDRRRHAEQEARLQEEMSALRTRVSEAVHEERLERIEQLRVAFAEISNLSKATPNVRIEDMLAHLSESDRSAVFQASLQFQPDGLRVDRMLLAAGSELASIEPASPDRIAERRKIDEGLGPLRSLSRGVVDGNDCVLVGAAMGLHVFDAETLEPLKKLHIEVSPPPRGGFNSSDARDGLIVAAHSELGLAVWKHAQATGEMVLTERTKGARTVRSAMIDDRGNLIFAADNTVLVANLSPVPTIVRECTCHQARVTALARNDDELYIGDESGRISRWAYLSEDACHPIQPPTGEPIGSLQVVTVGGIERLVCTDSDPWVAVRVLRDAFATRYQAPERLRWGYLHGDWVTAVDAARRSLYLWPTDRPEKPPFCIEVAATLRHTIQATLAI